MIRFFYLAGCLLLSFGLKAQAPTANFSASTVSGCATLVVVFKDESLGNPVYWNWDLGNGQLSNERNPVGAYTTPGTYTVSLVVRNADGTNGTTKTNYITVSPSPNAAFTSNFTTACSPATIQFTDQSTPAGAITSYNWTFQDGTTSNLQNPSKLYTENGYSNVTLTVTTANGCSSSTVRNRYIRIISGITPDFNFSRAGACGFPVNINFSNQTAGPGVLDYAWTFGNGQSSTLKDPSTLYASSGTYDVRLRVNSNFGCSGEITKPITLGNTNTSISAPASSCPGRPVAFVNSSTPAPVSSSWDFGDGTRSTQTNPSKIFTTPGTYTVTLTSKYPECEGVATQNIVITNQPGVDFTSANPTGCTLPYTVNFQNTSPDAVSYLWNFGDGTTSAAQNPSHVYNRTGAFNVTLSIITSGGCPATVVKNAFVNVNTSLSIGIQGVPKEGCAPLIFSPVAVVNSPEPVASYAWDFGDGGTASTANPTHVYTAGGTYNVTLTVQTVGGCQGTVTSAGAVKAGSLPVVDFSFNPATGGCAGVPIAFTDLSSVPVDKWNWDFGDGEQSSEQNPSHLFADTGLLQVKLTASNNGCSNSIIQPIPRITGPVAKFEPTVDCNVTGSRLVVTFVNRSIVDPAEAAATTYLWDFGFGGTTSTDPNPLPVTYPAVGEYTVTLTVTGPTCQYQFVRTIDLRVQQADFTIDDATICPWQPFKIQTLNIDPDEIKSYTWQIGTGTPFLGKSLIDTSFSVKGSFPVTLTIVDTFGCSSSRTITDFINIVGAEADFSVVNNGGCAGADIQFTDLSTAPITNSWKIDYGNGQVVSSPPPFVQRYTDSGFYSVILYIEDTYGCKDTTIKVNAVSITKNFANFGAEDTLFCPGGSLQFSDSSIGRNLTYRWDFGDGTTDNTANPVHVYPPGDATYSVKLYITDAVGCADSLTRTRYIRVVEPKPIFDAQDTVALCPPLQTYFNSTSKDYESLYWTFGDGNTSTLDTVSNFYNNYGTYTATLHTVGYGGCERTASKTIKVLNPGVDARLFYLNNSANCDSADVGFELTIPDNIYFYLNFGDGTVDSSGAKILSHRYRSPNQYFPFLVLVDALGCAASIGGGPGFVKVNGLLPLFNMDKKAFCDTGTIFFTDFTTGKSNDPLVSKNWDFGDGTTSAEDNPSHFYAQPGTYIVRHNTLSQAGCNNSFPDTVRVYRTPEATITGLDSLCLTNSLTLKAGTVVADTAIAWRWTAGSNVSTNVDLVLQPATAGQINVTLVATNKLGCFGDTSKLITVNPLPVINMPPSITTPVGNTVDLPVTYNDPELTYEWTPTRYLDCTDCAVPKAVEPKFSTEYTVKVIDNNTCTSSKMIQLITVCNNINYFVPNTFSPNGDGSNDWFYPRGTFVNNIQSLRIFNRWGQQVFERRNFAANDMNAGWNGLYNGKPATADVYVYILELVCDNAQIVPIKGNLTLIR
ncbi:MAG: PKD domain-containing protein [Chitinophagaceae bacterium]|nr:PKD domain-containing protein [Chitinophagaceae bacterium]